MKLEVIDTDAGLVQRADEWRALHDADPAAGVFLTPEWLLNWLAHFGDGRQRRFFLLSDASGPAALFPFVLQRARWRRMTVRTVGYCINSHSVRGGYLARPGCAGEALAVAAHRLHADRDWDMVVADGNDAAASWFDDARLSPHRGAPWSHSMLRVSGEWSTYRSSLPQDFRRNLRRAERDMRRLGELEFELVHEGPAVEGAIAAMFAIDAMSWKARRGETMTATEPLSLYYAGMVRAFAAAGKLVVALLRVGGMPVAMIIALRDKGVLYTLKSSFAMAIGSARVSPGNLLMLHLLQHAWDSGSREVDFVCRQPYTERWTSGVREFRQDLLFRPGLYTRAVRAVHSVCGYAARLRTPAYAAEAP